MPAIQSIKRADPGENLAGRIRITKAKMNFSFQFLRQYMPDESKNLPFGQAESFFIFLIPDKSQDCLPLFFSLSEFPGNFFEPLGNSVNPSFQVCYTLANSFRNRGQKET